MEIDNDEPAIRKAWIDAVTILEHALCQEIPRPSLETAALQEVTTRCHLTTHQFPGRSNCSDHRG
jgi:hypothetical protein